MKKILLCTDGSDYAGVCTDYAAWVAGRTGAAIEALYLTDIRQYEVPLVADISGSLGVQPYQNIVANIQELEKHKAAFIEEATRERLGGGAPDTALVFHHRTGLLVDCLDTFEPEVDLVLLGKRGEGSGSASGHLGSNLERVIRASSKPCLVTSRAFRPIQKIVLAYDGGASCRRAVEWLGAGGLAEGLDLHIVTVAEEGREDKALARLQEAEAAARGGGFEPVCQMLGGVVEEAIAHYVQQGGLELLVMGAYGHSRIRYLLIGSTTTAMIRDCHIPVLCFR